MQIMKNEEKFWDRISKNYDKGDKVDETYLKMLEIMKKYLKKDDMVMDFGCATGSISIDISSSVRKVIGIDISSEMIRIAKEKAIEHKAENVYFAKSTIFDRRHKENSFNAIMAFNILHLLDDTEEGIKRINKLLKPGGIFISSTACLGDKGKFVGGMISLVGKLGFFPNVKKFTASGLRKYMIEGGFDIGEDVILSEPSHPFIVARKK
jgi:ubiquinone/menaquinone biosynthesis C-methylase UbiE